MVNVSVGRVEEEGTLKWVMTKWRCRVDKGALLVGAATVKATFGNLALS